MVSTATRALELEAELAATIAAGGLVLDYQPVVGPDGAVLSAEALVRWPHPERGLIAPADFLPVAQRSGLMRELDLWVLRTATREAASWPVQHGGGAAVAVNLAGLLPADPDFLAAVTGIVESSGLAWNRLVLELVETSLVALPPHALAAMAELVDRGVRFAVDDFGTGYSSLARLQRAARPDGEGRPGLRQRRRVRPGRVRRGPRRRRHGPCDGAHHRGRGRRDRRAVPRAPRPGGGRLPGVAVLAPAARRRSCASVLAGGRLAAPAAAIGA